MKKTLLFIFSILLIMSSFAQEQKTNKVSRIVIDAGHGGDKPGAIGLKSKEKDINLAVALKLGKLIKDNLNDVEVYYTRVTDKDVELYRRSQIANKNKADLFISIHCNASRSQDAVGSETFTMGLTKSDANLEVAKKENADILLEANYKDTYEGFDPNSAESNIFFALYQNAYMEKSLTLADKVQKQFTSNTNLYNRGVKQAGFFVLFKSAMPSVLIELGFISNPKEEQYLMSAKGQYELAGSIFRAICEYKSQQEGVKINIPTLASLIPEYAIKADETRKRLEDEKAKELEIIKEKEKQAAIEKEIAEKRKDNEEKKNIVEKKSDAKKEENSLVYRVQFFTNANKIESDHKIFKEIKDVWLYQDNNLWKYTSGAFSNYKEAYSHQTFLRNNGYKDAFVVSFIRDKRIPLDKARQIEKNKK